jgi:SNF2 family DNA or RNA helicase
MRRLRTRRRLILTGTPVQNNLREMWSLFDFVTCGTVSPHYWVAVGADP